MKISLETSIRIENEWNTLLPSINISDCYCFRRSREIPINMVNSTIRGRVFPVLWFIRKCDEKTTVPDLYLAPVRSRPPFLRSSIPPVHLSHVLFLFRFLLGRDLRLGSYYEVERVVRVIEFWGFYPYSCSPKEHFSVTFLLRSFERIIVFYSRIFNVVNRWIWTRVYAQSCDATR